MALTHHVSLRSRPRTHSVTEIHRPPSQTPRMISLSSVKMIKPRLSSAIQAHTLSQVDELLSTRYPSYYFVFNSFSSSLCSSSSSSSSSSPSSSNLLLLSYHHYSPRRPKVSTRIIVIMYICTINPPYNSLKRSTSWPAFESGN